MRLLSADFPLRAYCMDRDKIGIRYGTSSRIILCSISHTVVVHPKGEILRPQWSPWASPQLREIMGSMSPRVCTANGTGEEHLPRCCAYYSVCLGFPLCRSCYRCAPVFPCLNAMKPIGLMCSYLPPLTLRIKAQKYNSHSRQILPHLQDNP